MIRALFLDVDGTLISFKTHRIPDSALDALLRAHERGVRLFIATGRAANDLEPLEKIPYDGVVSLNGARCVAADGRIVSQHLIPRADFARAMELGRQYGFPVALEMETGVFVDRVTPDVERVAHMVAHPVPGQTDLYALFDRSECCQMCFYFDAETQRRVMAELPSLVASRWCPFFADINVRGVDKSIGMQEFMAAYGLSAAEVAAFGDGGNDVAMLRAAGTGVAMGNACDEALNAADYIAASVDDDGIAKALKQLGVLDD